MDKLYISTLNKGNQNDMCLVLHLLVILSSQFLNVYGGVSYFDLFPTSTHYDLKDLYSYLTP